MKKLGLFFVVLAGLAWAGLCLAANQIPAPDHASFYAQDRAHILSQATKDYVNETGRELRSKTKAQVVVVTVPSLKGSVLEEYATDMFRTYGLGDARLNNGVLLLVALQEHQFRIEVGYGLEGALTDGFCGRVRDKFLTPAFKQQDYNKGIREAYTLLAARVAAEYKVSLSNLPPGTEKLVETASRAPAAPWWDVILGKLVLVVVIAVPVWMLFRPVRVALYKFLQLFGYHKGEPYQDPRTPKDGAADQGGNGDGANGRDSDGPGGDSGGGGSSGGGGASGGW
ncbi:MAG: TPM domain-containing protein [Acidaminococcaceae bacterium]|jgi:uncharacterized protein|nr:TPM domain-containing protein [Acidaminococcaceae bacterium]